MGIDISDSKEVIYNGSHQYRLVTDISKNPKVVSLLKGIRVYCVYRRTKDGDDKRDGNPLIYALKGINGYSITASEILKFRKSFRRICNKILASEKIQPETCDVVIVTLPSSKKIPFLLGRYLSKRLRVKLVDDILYKRTIKQVLSNFDDSVVREKDLRWVQKTIGDLQRADSESLFEMKLLDSKVRQYFEPIGVNLDSTELPPNSIVILVDDLLSSGTSLRSAASQLNAQGHTVRMAFTLLSDL